MNPPARLYRYRPCDDQVLEREVEALALTVVRMPKPKPKPTSTHRPEHAVLTGLLRELRLAAGLAQPQAAETLGLTQTSLSHLETGDRGFEILVVRDLVRIYGADWLAFVGELERRLAAGTTPASALINR